MAMRITELVLESLKDAPDARSKEVLASLIRHLHAFAREVSLTEEEWQAAVAFLTTAGQWCDDRRQELILISDVLGLSMVVDEINHAGAGTPSTVLGPFRVAGAREIAQGEDLAAGWPGEPLDVSGTVRGEDGRLVAGAWLEVWQADDDGLYDVQRPEWPARQLRARLRTDEEGRFRFRTIRPRPYPVPTDGPAGVLLARMGRHAFRPAHIHFLIEAPGYRPLVTHLFVAGDPYLAEDAVFAVKPSLVVEIEEGRLRHDFVLPTSG